MTTEQKSAYLPVSDFAPDPSQKSVTVEKNRLPQKLEGIVNNMLKADKTRAKVFSELLVDLNRF